MNLQINCSKKTVVCHFDKKDHEDKYIQKHIFSQIVWYETVYDINLSKPSLHIIYVERWM